MGTKTLSTDVIVSDEQRKRQKRYEDAMAEYGLRPDEYGNWSNVGSVFESSDELLRLVELERDRLLESLLGEMPEFRDGAKLAGMEALRAVADAFVFDDERQEVWDRFVRLYTAAYRYRNVAQWLWNE